MKILYFKIVFFSKRILKYIIEEVCDHLSKFHIKLMGQKGKEKELYLYI